jgi:hypothetical protein
MKKIFSFAVLLFVTVLSLQAQTVDEIIEKHLAAIGGKEKLLQLNTLKMEGNFTVQGMDIPVVLYQANNKGQRIELSVMGMTGYVINTPTEGWTFLPFQGQAAPEAMPAEAVKEANDGLDIQNPLLNYAEKGHKPEYIGKEDFEGTECLKMHLLMKGGSNMTMYFDPKTYYLIRQAVKTKATGQEIEQVQTFSNFTKTPEGYIFPMSMTGFGPGDITFTKVEINQAIDEALFKPAK